MVIGGGGQNRPQQQADGKRPVKTAHFARPNTQKFPAPQVPDTEATEPRVRADTRGY